MNKYDVIIAGAGTSGLPAAVSAARTGKKVLILEREYFIGGAVTMFMVNYFEGKPAQGIHKEVLDIMGKLDPKGKDRKQFRTPVWLAAWEMLMKDLDITILTGMPVINVKVSNGAIYTVTAGSNAYQAKVFIDATGDGILSRMAGIKGRFGREGKHEYGEIFAPDKGDNAVMQCTLLYTIRRMSDNPDQKDYGGYTPDECLIWGPTANCPDPTDPKQLSKLRADLYGKMPEVISQWREKGWTVIAVAPRVGVRETYRLVGDYTLSERDIFENRVHEDCICVCNNHIDPWDPEGNPLRDPKLKERCQTPDYGIPFRCLYNSDISNLFFVGRCASATHVAMSSIRVIPIVSVMGQVAGLAASMMIDNGVFTVKDIDVQMLRKKLRSQGVRVDL